MQAKMDDGSLVCKVDTVTYEEEEKIEEEKKEVEVTLSKRQRKKRNKQKEEVADVEEPLPDFA